MNYCFRNTTPRKVAPSRYSSINGIIFTNGVDARMIESLPGNAWDVAVGGGASVAVGGGTAVAVGCGASVAVGGTGVSVGCGV